MIIKPKIDSNTLLGDCFGGLSAMLVALPSAIAFGLVIYSAIGPEYAGKGAMAGIVGTIALGLIAPLFGATKRLITAPCAPAAAVMSVFVAESLQRGIAPEQIPFMLVMTALLAGLVQMAAGWLKGGRFIKYIPYPVVAGYLSGVGVLIFIAQFPKWLGVPKGVNLIHALAASDQWIWQSIVVGGITLLSMIFSPRIIRRVPGAIIALLCGVGSYFALSLLDPSLRQLTGNPLLIGPITSGEVHFFGNLLSQWSLLPDFSVSALASLFLPACTLAVLLSVDTLKTGLVLNALTRSRSDANRELIGQGLGNIASALACGMPGAGTMGATLVNVNSGGQTRLSSFLEGVFALLALLLLGRFIAWIPVAALAGILLVVAVRMVDPKIFKLLKQRSTFLDFMIILAVVISAVALSLIWAAAVGLSIAIFLFLRDQIKRPVVRRKLLGSETFSKKKRIPSEMEILFSKGASTVVFELQGQLFFGTTDQLLMEIEPALAKARTVILDMKRVQAVDYTAVYVLHQIEGRITEADGTLIFAALPQTSHSGNIRHYLQNLGFTGEKERVRFFESLDSALEWSEEQLLMAHTVAGIGRGQALSLAQFPFFSGVPESTLDLLSGIALEKNYQAGEHVFKRGDQGSELYFIRQGSVKIVLPIHGSGVHHLATFGRGDFFGDMSFLDHATRSADAVAGEPLQLYVMSRDDFDRLSKPHAEVAALVFERLARMLSERLRQTNIELEALEKA
ncbi:MAG: hypothetical protein A2293_06965 [Elusimicrobia bacterium RIFOXYB2_FULL_49_7]|nr:MAG: hypothetical protein A2293_06965 [Elusimicrobia bacterium RIFOXYB2_FULL_49_7]